MFSRKFRGQRQCCSTPIAPQNSLRPCAFGSPRCCMYLGLRGNLYTRHICVYWRSVWRSRDSKLMLTCVSWQWNTITSSCHPTTVTTSRRNRSGVYNKTPTSLCSPHPRLSSPRTLWQLPCTQIMTSRHFRGLALTSAWPQDRLDHLIRDGGNAESIRALPEAEIEEIVNRLSDVMSFPLTSGNDLFIPLL